MKAITNHRPAQAVGPAHLALARPTSTQPRRGRQTVPRVVRVTLEEVLVALQDCTDDDRLIVAVVSDLLRRGNLRAPLRWRRDVKYAAA